jgi:aminopeptidase 2
VLIIFEHRVVTETLGRMTTQENLTRIEEFFKSKDTARYSMALAQSLDKIRSSIKWLERDRKEVEEVSLADLRSL